MRLRNLGQGVAVWTGGPRACAGRVRALYWGRAGTRMFTHRLTIQLHHTDAYGIIFFANQFKFCHDAFQALLDELGFPLPPTRHDVPAMFVIVHAECDYKVPIHVGDKLTVELSAEKVGTTSLVMGYRFSNQHGVQVGTGRTVHVFIDTTTSRKVPLTDAVKAAFARHLS